MPADSTTADAVLSKRQLTAINSALARINDAIKECDVAEGCNIDCTAQRDDLEASRQMLTQIKATYFPSAK